MKDLELRVLAATVRGEAEGEGRDGMVAVAWAIRNRVTRPRWPSDVISVVMQPKQFSFWNGDSKRRASLLKDESLKHREAEALCWQVWHDEIPDSTLGSDHYFAPALVPTPDWAGAMKETVTIGGHVFYDSRESA